MNNFLIWLDNDDGLYYFNRVGECTSDEPLDTEPMPMNDEGFPTAAKAAQALVYELIKVEELSCK